MRKLLCHFATLSAVAVAVFHSSTLFAQADSAKRLDSPFWISTGRSYAGIDLGITVSDYFGSKNFLWGITPTSYLATYEPFNHLGTGIGFVGGVKGSFAVSPFFDLELKARFMTNHTSNTESDSIQLDPYVPTARAYATSSYSLTLSSLNGALLGHVHINDWLYGALGGSAALYSKNGFSANQDLAISEHYVNQVNHSYTIISNQQTPKEQIDNWFYGYRFDAQVGVGAVQRISNGNMLMDVELLVSIPFTQWLTKEADSSLNATASRWLQPGITDPHLWYATLTVGLRLPFLGLPPMPPPPPPPPVVEQPIKIQQVPLRTDSGIMLTGRVVDAKTGKPLIAQMTTVDLSNNSILSKTTTDSNGNYSVPVAGPGRFSVTADAPGYLFGTALFQVDSQGRILKDPEELKLSQLSGGKTRLLVFFEFDKADLQSASSPELDRAVGMMNAVPTLQIEIAGYTDSVGTLAHNMDLSLRRANAVRDYMVQHGIPESRIIAKGYGPSDPIAPNSTDEGRAQNRRVEFVVKSK